MSQAILGVSAYYHDSAAAIIIDGEIIAAAQEERFTRKKHDPSFPENAVKYVLEESGLSLHDLECVAFYDKPFIKFERLLETYHAFAPNGLKSFLTAIPVWIKEKLFMKKMLNEAFGKIGKSDIRFVFPEHHVSHAASAFYPSPFDKAAILTLDGVGEWATTTIGKGDGKDISILKSLNFPHSIGLLYSAFTYYCGFKVNSGEYKLMGLAPYGNPDSEQTDTFIRKILDSLVDIREDGSFLMNMDYFNYPTGLTMCHEKKWETLLGVPKRKPESPLHTDYLNLALAIQRVTEQIILKMAETTRSLTGMNNLVMAGGVALNCVANGKLLRSGIFDDIWIQPAAGDAGGALGAAYAAWHVMMEKERCVSADGDKMKGAYFGPAFSDSDIRRVIRKYKAVYTYYDDFEQLTENTAEMISQGNVIGWFQGRMEFGPRALGNRSIIGDAKHPEMQKKLNLKIKYREGFRPFAPSVMEEEIQNFFELDRPSPYMLLVAPVKKERCIDYPDDTGGMEMLERLYFLRSDVPAVTHIDYSARIQSVSRKHNPRYWNMINAFKNKTGFGLIVNTSFNVRGEPIVCTPNDAFRCFMRTEMDYLVMGNYFFSKADQKKLENDTNWREEFELD